MDSCLLLAEGTVERSAEGARAGGTPGSGDDSVRDLEAFLAALSQSSAGEKKKTDAEAAAAPAAAATKAEKMKLQALHLLPGRVRLQALSQAGELPMGLVIKGTPPTDNMSPFAMRAGRESIL